MSRRALTLLVTVVAGALSVGLTETAWTDCVDTPLTINFDAGSGMPHCYTESGMTVCAYQVFFPGVGSDAGLTLGDNDGNTSPDLENHLIGSGDLVYSFSMGGAPFAVTSFDFVNLDEDNGSGYFERTKNGNTSYGDFNAYSSGVAIPDEPEEWTNISSFTWTVTGPATGGQVMDNLSIVAQCCGNGVVDTGEQCDDGNTLGTDDDGNCCSSTCQFEANGSYCTHDENFCTADFCDGAGTCTHPDFPSCDLSRPCGPTRSPGNVLFEHPKKTSTIYNDLVQVFVSCGNPGGNTPSTTTEGGIPSCTNETPNEEAGAPTNGWRWDEDKGKGSVKIKGTCRGAADASLKLKITGVVDGNGAPANTMGSVAVTVNVALDDPTGGNMSTIPITGVVPLTLLNGNGGLTTTLGVMLTESGMSEIPNGSSIELLDVQVRDPNGNAFAAPGLFLP